MDEVIVEGIITPAEIKKLKEARAKLGLSVDEADIISDYIRIEKETGRVLTDAEKAMKIALNNRCPRCGKPVDRRQERKKKK